VGMHCLHGNDVITAIYYIRMPSWDQSSAPVDVPCTPTRISASKTESRRTATLNRLQEYRATYANNNVENRGSGSGVFPSTEIQQNAETSDSGRMPIGSDSASGISTNDEMMGFFDLDAINLATQKCKHTLRQSQALPITHRRACCPLSPTLPSPWPTSNWSI
jgi:hypothetical protein